MAANACWFAMLVCVQLCFLGAIFQRGGGKMICIKKNYRLFRRSKGSKQKVWYFYFSGRIFILSIASVKGASERFRIFCVKSLSYCHRFAIAGMYDPVFIFIV